MTSKNKDDNVLRPASSDNCIVIKILRPLFLLKALLLFTIQACTFFESNQIQEEIKELVTVPQNQDSKAILYT